MPTVASLTPANAAARVANDQPVVLELTRTDSNDYTKIETSQADFALGTLVSVAANSDGTLGLDSIPVFNDGYGADTVGATPAGYSVYTGSSGNLQVQVIDSQQAVRSSHANGMSALMRTTPSASDWDIKVDFQLSSSTLDPFVYVRCTGAFASRSGYAFIFHADIGKVYIDKMVAGTETNVANANFSYSTGVWYTARIQAIGSALKVKLWLRSGSEPGTWTLETTDASVSGAGSMAFGSYYGAIWWMDNVRTVATAGGYQAAGSRISPAYPLSAVGKFGTAVVQYDATVPANTTLVVRISKDASTWTAVANGDRIALWAEGDNLAAAAIYVKAELATTDSAVTPVLAEVRLIFLPVDSSLVEIDIDGIVHTIANGKLDVWNTAKVAAGPVIVDCHQDLYFATRGRWTNYGPKSYTVLVKYNGTTISTTTFTNEAAETYVAWLPFSYMATVGNGVYDGPMSAWAKFFVGGFEGWLVRGEFHYLVAEIPRGAFDARYWVARPFAVDEALSGIVGEPGITDLSLSGALRGWLRADNVFSGAVQGWMREDSDLSGIAGNPIDHDESLSGIAALPIETEQALSGGVYEVNDNNAFDLRVISVEEAALLDALGLLRQ